MSRLAAAKTWLPYRKTKREPAKRLFLFPYVGGGASVFRKWDSAFPKDWDLCPIQLPGRESRINEPLYTRLDALAETLAEDLQPWTDIPYMVFGHSMGTLIAFEFMRALRRKGCREPEHLFVSGFAAPHVRRSGDRVRNRTDEEVCELLQDYAGTPPAVLQDEELLPWILPKVRADFELIETYVYRDEAPFHCPITGFCGRQDPVVSTADIEAWKKQTVHHFHCYRFPGDHFFLHEHFWEMAERMVHDHRSGSPSVIRASN